MRVPSLHGDDAEDENAEGRGPTSHAKEPPGGGDRGPIVRRLNASVKQFVGAVITPAKPGRRLWQRGRVKFKLC